MPAKGSPDNNPGTRRKPFPLEKAHLVRNGLPESSFGLGIPKEKKGHYEATIRRNNSRGRIVEELGDEVRIYLYASGDEETLQRGDVSIYWKAERA